MDKRGRLILKILDTMIELNNYSDVDEVAQWLRCGTDKHLSVDELRTLKADVKEHGTGSKYTVKQLKKNLSHHRFMLRVGKAVVRCRYLHEFGLNIPFRFFVLPDWICSQVYLCMKKLKDALKSEGEQT